MRYTRRSSGDAEKLNFWQSYSDMMAALLLVLALVLTGTLLEARQLYEEDHDSLWKQQQKLDEQQAMLDEQQETLDEQQRIIDEQQRQLEMIIGVRSELILALREEFADSDFSVTIDPQTGAITFDSNLLFNSDEYKLKEEGETFLSAFLPKYFHVLLGNSFTEYIAEIIIEGHTDTDGGYIYNLELSQNRALEVAKYCLESEHIQISEEERDRLRGLLTANGRSWSAPVLNGDGMIDMDASRRVEIKFRLKDDEMMEQLARLFEETR